MKIGIDARLWSQSGVGRYTRNLVDQLQKIDKKNEYVLFMGKQDADDFRASLDNKQDSRFKVVEVDIKWHSLAEQLKFPKILKKHNLDLVHFPYFSVPISYNRPYVVTIHDLIINHFSTGKASTLNPFSYYIKRLGYFLTISQSAKKARKVLTVSKATKKEIVSHLGLNEDKIVTTYEGADVLISSNSKRPIMYGRYFLYVGNAYPHKNLERLIAAFENFKQQKIKLILVGPNDFFYKRLKKKIKNSNVIFLGTVSDSDLANLYEHAVAFISSSLMEGFGLPIVEAMTKKCSVVASDIPVFREITKNNAIFFDPYDKNDIYKKMDYVQENYSKLGRMRSDAFNESKKYSWTKMTKETLKVYEDCISLR